MRLLFKGILSGAVSLLIALSITIFITTNVYAVSTSADCKIGTMPHANGTCDHVFVCGDGTWVALIKNGFCPCL